MKINDIPSEILELGGTDPDTRQRLRNWRNWCQSYNRSHLYFPPASPIVRLMTPDKEARRQPRIQVDEIDSWKVECAVTALGVVHPSDRRMLIVQYFLEHLPKETRRRAFASEGRAVGQTKYYELLQIAHGRLKKILTCAD